MGNLSQIMPPAGISVHLPTPAWLMDHHFQGRPVLPAVEAMEALARTAKEACPDLRVNHITGIRFDKFLYLDPDRRRLDAMAELQPSDQDNQSLQARLTTRTRAPRAAITRTKVHALLAFSQSIPGTDDWPMDVAAAPEGICIKVSPERLYAELVPFGPAFRNIAAPVWISPDGVLACIRTPDISRETCLGTPFALDAAMHAACAWGQHFHGFVPFPVAMERRWIIRPTQPGAVYYGRVRPRSALEETLVVDIELRDSLGNLCESIFGVHMRDVSGGRLRPPQWIIRSAGPHPLEDIGRHCLGLTAVELDATAPFADQALTPSEKERLEKMGPRRRKGFLAARLALKRLFRHCRNQGFSVPAHAIQTVCLDSPRPLCRAPEFSNGPDLHCSVSHDKRLAIAAAHSGKVGVDIEEITHKTLKAHNIYMDDKEIQRVRRSHLEDPEAALRVWSIKEAAAKAYGIILSEAWQSVKVTHIGETMSRFEWGGKNTAAHHAVVDDHVITLIADN
jgi:phosphopantetheinyl transferase